MHAAPLRAVVADRSDQGLSLVGSLTRALDSLSCSAMGLSCGGARFDPAEAGALESVLAGEEYNEVGEAFVKAGERGLPM